MLRTLKTIAIATTIVLATAGASMAATWAYVDNNAKVRDDHYTGASTVNWVQEGQKVKVIGQWKNWYKLQLKGPDGWVKANVLDFDYYDDDYYPVKPGYPGFGSSFCVDGKNAQFCLGTQF
ncbi:SH3 domain-containing protein [Devosia sp. CN2-171]|uniref:SH3 domain-containing protein n=1 Tax=Devosia sp. CN2-171 TaxID=3400909 RepID=UPI003BF7D5C7